MPERPGPEPSETSAGTTVGAPQFSILSNQPGGAAPARDRLGLSRSLAPLHDLLRHAQTPTPVMVALTAPPGGGKTSALRWLESRLQTWNESKPTDGAGVPVRIVWFRPARHGRQMRIALLSEVLLGTVDFAMLSVDALRRLLQVFRPLLGAGFARAAALAKLQQGAAVGARGKADFAWVEALLDERDTGPVFDDQLLSPVLTEFQTYVRSGLRGGERLIVVVDDIDDLSRRELDALGRRVLPDLQFDGVVTLLSAAAETIDRLPGGNRASLRIALPPVDESARADLLVDRIRSIEADSLWSSVPPQERRDIVAAVTDPAETPAAAVLALNEVSAAARHRAAAAVGAARLQEFRVALRRAAAERLLQRHHAWSTLLAHSFGQTLFAAWAGALNGAGPEDLPTRSAHLRAAISDATGTIQHHSGNPEEHRLVELARAHPQAHALGRILADARIAALVRHGWTAEPPAPESDSLAVRIVAEAARRSGETGPPESWHSVDLSGLELHTLAPLSACANLRSLRARGVTCGDVEPLAGLRRLETLDLRDTPVRDIHALAGLRALRELSLDRTRVDDLSPLADLSELQSLTLSGTSVVDLLPLAGLDALERLDLSGTPVQDVRPLAAPLRLRWLDLSGAAVDEVSGLAGAPQLEALRLANTPVTVVSPLARLETLRTLDLSGTRVIDPSPLASLESLTDLDLSATPLRELGDWLSKLIGLRRLNLSLTGVRNVQPLADLNGLVWLGLTGVELEDESPLRRLRRLRHIER